MRIPPPNLRFVTADVTGPLVYLVERDGKPLYVGMTRFGLDRPLDRRHRSLRDLRVSDRFSIWRFDRVDDATAFEADLIVRLQPARNKNGLDGRTTHHWLEFIEPHSLLARGGL